MVAQMIYGELPGRLRILIILILVLYYLHMQQELVPKPRVLIL